MALDFIPAPEIVALTLQRQQLGMTLMLLFGASAILLAAVGIYGVIAHASAQRRGEMATRLALGASRPAIFLLMMRRGGFLAALGAAIGLFAAYGSGRVVASQLYEVRASDPVILTAAFALVVVIALMATAIPAGRAARVDPVKALRPE
jgi:ABC-type antimicrobial peptide transport system permease subunit